MTKSIVQFAKKKILRLSRQSLMQTFWESLLNKSLVGMNYWGGARFLESGELNIVKNSSSATGEIDNISRFNIGFGEREEILKIHFTKDKEELTSLYDNIPEREFTSSADVKIQSIDQFLKENNIPKIDYLKIDVEGHELKVLEGAKETLDSQKINYIQFEFGESMIDARVFFRDFWNWLYHNYLIYRILPDDIREIKKYSESLEIFHCVNYIAVSKLVK